MLRDLFKFFWLCLGIVIAFSSLGMLTFSELANFENLYSTFNMFLQAGLGGYDYAQFEYYNENNHPIKYHLGIWFFYLIQALMTLVFINLIISIMLDTYAELSENRIGLYQ